MLDRDTMKVLKKDENGTLVLRCTCDHSFVAFIRDNERPVCPMCGTTFSNMKFEIEHALDVEEKKSLQFFKVRVYIGGRSINTAVYGHSMSEACFNLSVAMDGNDCDEIKFTKCSRKEFLDTLLKRISESHEIPSPLEDILDRLHPEY